MSAFFVRAYVTTTDRCAAVCWNRARSICSLTGVQEVHGDISLLKTANATQSRWLPVLPDHRNPVTQPIHYPATLLLGDTPAGCSTSEALDR